MGLLGGGDGLNCILRHNKGVRTEGAGADGIRRDLDMVGSVGDSFDNARQASLLLLLLLCDQIVQ